MCKLRHKVHNGKNITPQIKFYKLYFSKAFYRQIMQFFHKIETILLNQSAEVFFVCFLLKAPKCGYLCVNCVTNCAIPKMYLNVRVSSFSSRFSNHFPTKTLKARELKLLENFHLPPCVTCHMSHVMCHMSCVMCYLSCVPCHMSLVFFFSSNRLS